MLGVNAGLSGEGPVCDPRLPPTSTHLGHDDLWRQDNLTKTHCVHDVCLVFQALS